MHQILYIEKNYRKTQLSRKHHLQFLVLVQSDLQYYFSPLILLGVSKIFPKAEFLLKIASYMYKYEKNISLKLL